MKLQVDVGVKESVIRITEHDTNDIARMVGIALLMDKTATVEIDAIGLGAGVHDYLARGESGNRVKPIYKSARKGT